MKENIDIYCITNNINNKCYIGQTTNSINRINGYKKLRCKRKGLI